MITLNDLLRILSGPMAAIAAGVAVWARYGPTPGVLAAILGWLVGSKLGAIPHRRQLRRAIARLGPLSTGELRRMLRDPACATLGAESFHTPNWLLLELRVRGEDVRDELALVLDWMEVADLRSTLAEIQAEESED